MEPLNPVDVTNMKMSLKQYPFHHRFLTFKSENKGNVNECTYKENPYVSNKE